MVFSFTKDIVFSIGSNPGQCNAFYSLKNALVAGGWIVMSSGTGTGGTYNGLGDAISSASVLRGDRSWYRIRAPSGTREWIIQNVATGGGDNWWRIKICRNGFTGGSPSANVTPTGDATDTTIFGGGTDASPSGSVWTYDSPTMRVHIGVDSASPYGWFMIGNIISTATQENILAQQPIDGYSLSLGDTDPYIYHCIGYYEYNRAQRSGNYIQMNTNSKNGAWAYWSSTTPATDIQALLMITYNTSAGNSIVIPSSLPANPWNAKDEMFPIVWARFTNRTGQGGYKGTGTLMYWVGQNRGTGNTFSINSANDRYALGDVSLPWDGSIPNI